MVAKNPRWPQQNSVFDIFASWPLESDETRRTKIIDWNGLNLYKKNLVNRTIFEWVTVFWNMYINDQKIVFLNNLKIILTFEYYTKNKNVQEWMLHQFNDFYKNWVRINGIIGKNPVCTIKNGKIWVYWCIDSSLFYQFTT